MAEQAGGDIQMDGANLYREETYTDMKAGSLRKLVPVKADGTEDPGRAAVFTAVTQVMTPGGVLPLSGEVAGAKTLAEALAAACLAAASRASSRSIRSTSLSSRAPSTA